MSLILLSFSLLISLIFFVAAYTKFAEWHELPGVIQNFRILPQHLVPIVAILLPIVEILIAVSIFIKPFQFYSAISACLLFIVFGVALGVNLYRGRTEIDCGCFRTALKQRISKVLVARNLLLSLMSLLIAFTPTIDLSLFSWFMATCAAIVLFLCYLSIGTAFQTIDLKSHTH